MIGLVCPYDKPAAISRPQGTLFETIQPGCFADALRSLTTPKGRPIPLVRGHKRRKQNWTIATTADRLRLWSDERGLWLSCEGRLPLDFSGFSVCLAPIRWRRINQNSFLLSESKIKHIALLTSPDQPAYPQTFLASIKASMAEKNTLEV